MAVLDSTSVNNNVTSHERSECVIDDTETLDDLVFQDFVFEGEQLEDYVIDNDLNDRLLEDEIMANKLEFEWERKELEWEWKSHLDPTCNCHSEFGLDDDGEVRHLGLDCSFNV